MVYSPSCVFVQCTFYYRFCGPVVFHVVEGCNAQHVYMSIKTSWEESWPVVGLWTLELLWSVFLSYKKGVCSLKSLWKELCWTAAVSSELSHCRHCLFLILGSLKSIWKTDKLTHYIHTVHTSELFPGIIVLLNSKFENCQDRLPNM